ncbi:sigma-70 family RNA polymerase sigma factor [Erwinia sp. S43]|uniref:sigma-70 family RNA polymerase sigma factor n=1 Tax=Erwinia sp. S43 TaxID=2769339 RepID=UPI00190B032D|nr:sigma-70 family RNA polymerase sigma factor [Erwinia sp. S43]MBK0035488.1 sigma-70 family RNA polymerase sigma factor [Erwinia sp. S43]
MSVINASSASEINQLYLHHHGWLRGILRKRLGNLNDAADLAHDVFIQLLLKPRSFDSSEGARAYLSVMAHGMCVDLWRRKELEEAWLKTMQLHARTVVISTEYNVLILETLLQIDTMLRSLPEKVRATFIMSQIQGRTYAQIALTLQVSERMVKKYMAKAMLHCVLLEAELSDATLYASPSGSR